jgi:hypothetical protein
VIGTSKGRVRKGGSCGGFDEKNCFDFNRSRVGDMPTWSPNLEPSPAEFSRGSVPGGTRYRGIAEGACEVPLEGSPSSLSSSV